MSAGRIVDEFEPGARVDERSHWVTLELPMPGSISA